MVDSPEPGSGRVFDWTLAEAPSDVVRRQRVLNAGQGGAARVADQRVEPDHPALGVENGRARRARQETALVRDERSGGRERRERLADAERRHRPRDACELCRAACGGGHVGEGRDRLADARAGRARQRQRHQAGRLGKEAQDGHVVTLRPRHLARMRKRAVAQLDVDVRGVLHRVVGGEDEPLPRLEDHAGHLGRLVLVDALDQDDRPAARAAGGLLGRCVAPGSRSSASAACHGDRERRGQWGDRVARSHDPLQIRSAGRPRWPGRCRSPTACAPR